MLNQHSNSPTTDRILLAMNTIHDIQVGDEFTLYAGCDKSPDICRTKFSNIVNFRGEPYVPGPDFLKDTDQSIGLLDTNGLLVFFDKRAQSDQLNTTNILTKVNNAYPPNVSVHAHCDICGDGQTWTEDLWWYKFCGEGGPNC